MSDSEPIALFGSRPPVSATRKLQSGPVSDGVETRKPEGKWPDQTFFHRRELTEILKVYGRKVADGEWRDYAIDATRDKAVFSIFRRSSEMPLYRIEKQPRLARKQGTYSVITATGLILKRGQDLAQVLRAIDRKPRLVVA